MREQQITFSSGTCSKASSIRGMVFEWCKAPKEETIRDKQKGKSGNQWDKWIYNVGRIRTAAIPSIPTIHLASIEAYLQGLDLYKFIDGSHPPPSPTIKADGTSTPHLDFTTWYRQDRLLFGALVGTLSSPIASLINHAPSSFEAWQILAKTYASPSRGHIKQLQHRLKQTTKTPNQNITDYMHSIKQLVDELAILDKVMDTEDITDLILHGLDQKAYKAVIDSIHARDTPILFHELHEKLINHELSIAQQTVSQPPTHQPVTAFHAQQRPSSKPWHNRSNNPSPGLQPTPQTTSPSSPRPYLGKCQWLYRKQLETNGGQIGKPDQVKSMEISHASHQHRLVLKDANCPYYCWGCLCTFVKRNLHPSCLGCEQTLEAAHGLTLRLEKAAASNCLHCGTKDLWSKVRGWAYVSSCGTYSYHVSCVKEIINKNWRHGFFTGKSDPFRTIKEQFPEDMDKRHKLVVGRSERQTRRKTEAVLSVIFNVLTGNPLGLIGDARSFFGTHVRYKKLHVGGNINTRRAQSISATETNTLWKEEVTLRKQHCFRRITYFCRRVYKTIASKGPTLRRVKASEVSKFLKNKSFRRHSSTASSADKDFR
ncbi:hypothetical protein E3N88_35616 [Mikania micrantha]|uniref:Uncharacterized protein n=1 Tax=Mikania micrantha TaxID=192012 RepID=A0A5N6M2C6_9ASTR|nr:hypothetical protein E3N88_35616 [Mikania micrantha]